MPTLVAIRVHRLQPTKVQVINLLSSLYLSPSYLSVQKMAASKFDSVEAFAQFFASCRFPAVVQDKIKGLYETPLELHFVFQGKAEVMEERREKLVLKLCSLADLKIDEEDRLMCGMAGRVRRLLH